MQARIVSAVIAAGVVVVLGLTGVVLTTASKSHLAALRHAVTSPTPTATSKPILQPSVSPTPVMTVSPEPSPTSVATPTASQTEPSFRELLIPKPGGNAYAIVVGQDGAVWFTESECVSGIGRLSEAGTWQHWPITGDCESQPLAITRGPDGNLWFADVWSAYGRVTPDGEITRFTLPESCYPSGITFGPDGNIWLAVGTPQPQSFIAKVTTDGTELAEYQLSASAGMPRGIVAGPDGAIWFTESRGIGRLTTSGVLTEFPVHGSPYQIAVGPDKNLWFVETAGGIGRLTTGGALTEFETPGLGGLQWITVGPDDAMWFTAAASDSIGRISMAGDVTSYALPNGGSQPIGIMSTPDGKIWFTEASIDATGRIGILTLKS